MVCQCSCIFYHHNLDFCFCFYWVDLRPHPRAYCCSSKVQVGVQCTGWWGEAAGALHSLRYVEAGESNHSDLFHCWEAGEAWEGRWWGAGTR